MVKPLQKPQALTLSQRLLLRSALLEESAALKAWHQWQKAFHFDAVEADEFWLLPQVYANLAGSDINGSGLAKLKGTYKQMRLRNEIKERHLLTVLKSLESAEVPAIPGIFPTLALVSEDHDAIPLRQLDLVVQLQSLPLIDETLQAHAWIPERTAPAEQLAPFIEFIKYQHALAGELYVHLRPFSFDCSWSAQQEFWQRLRGQQVHDVKLQVAGVNDLLLMACLNKSLVEIVVFLNRMWSHIDWLAVQEVSARAGAGTVLHSLFRTLPPELNEGLPESIAHGQSVLLHHHSPDEASSLLALVRDLRWRYHQAARDTLRHPDALGFPRMVMSYYHYTWQTQNFRQLISLGMRKTCRRVKQAIQSRPRIS